MGVLTAVDWVIVSPIVPNWMLFKANRLRILVVRITLRRGPQTGERLTAVKGERAVQRVKDAGHLGLVELKNMYRTVTLV